MLFKNKLGLSFILFLQTQESQIYTQYPTSKEKLILTDIFFLTQNLEFNF